MTYIVEYKYTPGINEWTGRIDVVTDKILETIVPPGRTAGYRHFVYENLKPECFEWFDKNINGIWTYWFGLKYSNRRNPFTKKRSPIPDGNLYFEFEDAKDAMLFKLKWV